MRKLIAIIASMLCVVAMALGLAACGGGSKLAVDKSELDLFVGDTYQLVVTYDGAKPSGTVGYLSDNKAVATVSDKGLVTGVSVGTAKITVEYTEGTSVNRVTCKVTVTEDTSKLVQYTLEKKESESDPMMVTGKVDLKFYNTGKVKVNLIHQGYEGNIELDYTANGSSLTAKQADSTFITLEANDYGKNVIIPFMAFLGVTMGEQTYINDLTVSLAADYLTVVGNLYLTEEAKNAGVGDKTTFGTFNMTQAEATKLGITLADRVDVTSISVENILGEDGHKQEYSLVAGEVRIASVKVEPENATVNTYTVKSNDDKIVKATVDTANGGVRIEAVAAGSTTITIASDSDNTKTATLTVTVTAPESNVKLVKGEAGAGASYLTLSFKNDGKVKLSGYNGLYSLTAYLDAETDYSVDNNTITFTACEATVTGIGFVTGEDGNPTLGMVTTTYTITLKVETVGNLTSVEVTAKEKDKPEATEISFGSILLTSGDNGDFAKLA